MEINNYLGVYIGRNTATVVCVDSQSKGGEVVGCFSVRTEEQGEMLPRALANLVSQGCSQRQWRFSEVSVALDCAMFMQHSVHSEFADARQIGATVRFDTEEALATDISDVALAFKIISGDQNGSNLTVFTAKKKTLSDLLLSLQSNGMDPVGIEPDVNCLARYIARKVAGDRGEHGRTMFGVLSARSGYLMAMHQNGADDLKAARVRTFLVGSTKDRSGLLAREAIMTAALTESREPISRVRVFDSAGPADYQRLSESLGIEASTIELVGPDIVNEQVVADVNPVDFAIACGAALGQLDKTSAVSFRDDFMPYQGKKVRMQRALRFFSISVTVLLIAMGLYFQTRIFNVNKNRAKIRQKFAQDYAIANSNIKLADNVSIKQAVARLDKIKNGLTGPPGASAANDSVASKLALVLDAFNKSAEQTNLNITKVSIGEKNINISGWTSSRANTRRFFETVKQAGLTIDKEGTDVEPGRDMFNITVRLSKK
ncbi:MAG: hypothetical protein JXN61_14815 [Sedimentisphaerales bacterium]|nr:hypothetical protein [Sedimentisphaerales bacterium]